MKKFSRLFSLTILITLLAMVMNINAQEREVNWDAFSKNLVMAIRSSNEGLQLSAMGMIIRYSDNLNVDEAVFDIVRIFRMNKDSRIRILAMVTLHKTQNNWAMYYLTRNLKFEKDERVKKQCCQILNSYYASKERPAEERENLSYSDKTQ